MTEKQFTKDLNRAAQPERRVERPSAPLLLNIEEAAITLQLTPEALRARCRRGAAKQADGTVIARLAPGVVGLKLGQHWRIRFDAT